MIIGLFFAIFGTLGLLMAIREIVVQKKLPPEQQYNGPRLPKTNAGDIVIDGKDWDITNAEIVGFLQKRCSYYRVLNAYRQQLFLERLVEFIRQKIFIIKSTSGYREMPVLTSAAAIQLTFGLRDFLLPWYRYIQIYPEEFLSQHHAFKILAGNVSSRTITIAWTHLLSGYENDTDGVNVALHEMSLALFFQKPKVEKLDALQFCNRYHALMQYSKLARFAEINGKTNLYSDYGTTNLQEFWAESVELFFERSADLKKIHPHIYRLMITLLNQDPLNKENIVNDTTRIWLLKTRIHILSWLIKPNADSQLFK